MISGILSDFLVDSLPIERLRPENRVACTTSSIIHESLVNRLTQNLSAWALDGAVFDVLIPRHIHTFSELRDQTSAMKQFKHTPCPYMSFEELKKELTKLGD